MRAKKDNAIHKRFLRTLLYALKDCSLLALFRR
jgi:hypothetical protein